MNVIKADLAQPILLGKQGEHGVTQIVFDLSGYIKKYGDGVAQLTVKRSGDPLEYAVWPERVENTAVWEIGAEWTQNNGQGYCYLHWFVDDDHAKFGPFKTMVQESKSACDAPEPQAGYLDQITSIGVKADKAAESAGKSADVAMATAKRFDETFSGVVQTAERNAVEANERAQEAAGNARTSAENAANSEQVAAEHRAAAETAEAGAEEAKQGALSAAERAEAAAVKEGAYAEQAGVFAGEAGAANEQAQEAAGNAQRSAENAAASEQTVKESADNAAASEENARASAESASASEQAAAEHRAAAETAEAGAEEAKQGALSAAERAEAAAVKEGAYAEQAGVFAGEAGAANESAQAAAGNAQRSAENAAASERASAEHRAATEEAEELAKSYTANPPVIGGDGNWWTWNGSQYVDSGNVATGELTVRQGNTLYANALKGTASGAVIRVDDVSPLEHTVPVRVRRKNLYNNVAYGFISGAQTGFIATKTETGYTLTGSFSNGCWVLIPLCSLSELGGKVLTVSANISGTPHQPALVICDKAYGNRKVVSGTTLTNGATTMAIPQAGEHPDGYIVTVRLNGDKNSDPAAVVTYDNIQVELGATRTAYTPYVPDLTDVAVKALGKNLFDYRDWCDWCDEVDNGNGNADDTYLGEECFSFRNYKSSETSFYRNIKFKEGTQYTISCEFSFSYNSLETYSQIPILAITYTDGARNYFYHVNPYSTIFQSAKFVSAAGKTISSLDIPGFSSGCRMYIKKNMQIEEGAVATAFEPYQCTEYTPAEDGTCEVTSITPTMTLTTDTEGAVMDCEYNRDINKAFEQLTQAILSMGGNI